MELAYFFWKGYFALGSLHLKSGKTKEALPYFEKVLSYNPNDYVSYSVLVSTYYSEGNREKVKYYLEKAIKQGVNQAYFYQLLGIIYIDEKNYEKAEEALQAGISMEDLSVTDLSNAQFYMGVLYDKTERREEMEDSMKQAIKLHPDNAMALNYLGYTYLVQDRKIEEAYRMIKKAYDIEPNNGAFLDSLGWAYYKKGDYQSAQKYLERAAEKEKDEEVYGHLGHLYLKLEEYEKALLWFVKAHEISGSKETQKILDEILWKILEK